MPIDTSIYSNSRPMQVSMPSPLDVATKSASLAQLGYQNQQAQYQMQQQQAMRDAFRNNVNPDGSINYEGAISSLGKSGYGQVALKLQQNRNAMAKAQAESRSAQMDAQSKMTEQSLPVMETLNSMPESDRAKAFPGYMKQLEAKGVEMPNFPKDQSGNFIYDPGLFKQGMDNLLKSKQYLAQQQTIAETNEKNAAMPKQGAEELGKYTETINDPSTRKTLGSLTDIVNRSSRIKNLLNAGAKPNETPEERIARLNQALPMIGNALR